MMSICRGVLVCGAAGTALGGALVLAAGLSTVAVISSERGRAFLRWLAGTVLRLGVRASKWWLARRMTPSTNHGSARWVTATEAARAGLFGDDGLIIGTLNGRVLRHPSNEANMVVFAPQGAGKGVGVVIPNLLTHRGSVICIDHKGENLAVTGDARLALGPVWSVSMADGMPSHRFNPMDCIVVGGGNEVAEAGRLADLIMPHEVTSDAHWRTKSVQWATGLILHVATRFADEPSRRNLGTVHAYLTLRPTGFAKLLDAMAASHWRGVREVAAEIERGLETGEGLSILSSMAKGTALFSLARRSGVLCAGSDFALADLFGDRPASLFLQVPLGEMALYAPWLRVMVGLANHASMSVVDVPDARPLFVLDEAATLGEIKEIQDTIGQGRAYHQKLFIYQDMAQLKRANPGWASVLANCQINMAFAVNDLETAEMLSKRIGDQTVMTRHTGISSGADAVLAHHQNIGQGEHGRRLLQPNEILHMDERAALVSVAGLGLRGPLTVERMVYHREPMFAGRYGTWQGRGLMPIHRRLFSWLEPAAPGPALIGDDAVPTLEWAPEPLMLEWNGDPGAREHGAGNAVASDGTAAYPPAG